MIKIAICDDEQIYLHDLRRLLSEKTHIHDYNDFDIHTFSNPLNLLEKVMSGTSFDIFLLDIYMPDMTGIALAEKLRKESIDSPIVFLTTSKAHALDAFGVGAVQYLLKPFKGEDFWEAMAAAIERVHHERHQHIIFKSEGGLQSVPIRNIIFSESQSNYQELHMIDGTLIKLRMTSAELYEHLIPFSCFARCGIAYILNLGQTKRIDHKNAIMSDGTSISIPRTTHRDLKKKYFEFYGKEEV